MLCRSVAAGGSSKDVKQAKRERLERKAEEKGKGKKEKKGAKAAWL